MKKNKILLTLGAMVCSLGMICACGSGNDEVLRNSEINSSTQAENGSEITSSTEISSVEETANKYSPVEFIEPDGSFSEKVTVMVYVTGSDLESKTGAATNDMEEILISGVDLSLVNVLVYTGGSEQWHNDVPSDKNSIFRLTETGYQSIAQYDSISMGDPENLSRFLSYAYENYPADTFNLILWDHGNGPVMGYGLDKQYNNDSLTLEELGQALANSPFNSDNKLGFIGFDACLMASAELACTVEPYANYLISSQETEPGFGWDYSFLNYCGKLPAKDLAQNIVSLYLDYCDIYYASKDMYDSDVTLSVMDLQYTSQLQEAINTVFARATDDVSGYYNKLVFSRVQSRGLGRASTGSEYDLVDLVSLMANMEEQYPEETQAVLDLLEKSILVNGYNTTGCSGISMYYPFYNKTYFEKSWKETYESLNVFPNYLTFLERYSQIWLGTEMTDYFEGTITPTAEGDHVFSMTLTPELDENYADSQYCILQKIGDTVYQIVYTSGDITKNDNVISANFNGKVIYFEDPFGDKFIPLTINTENHDTYSSYRILTNLSRWDTDDGQYSLNIDSSEFQLEVNSLDDSISVKGFYITEDDSDLELGKKPEVDLSQWRLLNFPNLQGRYLTRKENGAIADFFDWPTDGIITWNEMSTKAPVKFVYEPIYDDGSDYFIMFRIKDVYQNVNCSELLPIVLDAAPEETPLPETEVNWQDNSAILADNDDVTVKLVYANNNEKIGGDYFIIADLKSEDNDVEVRIENIIINDNLFVPASNSCHEELTPGQRMYFSLSGLKEYTNLLGTDVKSISMDFQVRGLSSFLVSPEKIKINNVDTRNPLYICDSFLGAAANQQTLITNEDCTITLDYFGFTGNSVGHVSGGEYSKLSYNITTVKNNENAKVSLVGIVINNKVISISSTPDYDIPVGAKVSNYFYHSISDLYDDGITSINTVSVLAEINDVPTLLPVTLAESGEPEEFTPSGDLIYEDETISIFCTGTGEDENYDGTMSSTYDLIIVNKSDKTFNANVYYVLDDGSLDTEDYVYFGNPYIVSNAVTSTRLTLSNHALGKNNSIAFFEYDGFERGYTTGRITLPEK